mgnify:CR=1 FL=1
MVGLGAAAIVVAVASLLASLLDAPDAAPLLRVVAIAGVAARYSEVRRALLERSLSFRRSVGIQSASVAVGWIAAVVAASQGAGAWSMVIQLVTTEIVQAAALATGPGRRVPALHRDEIGPLWTHGREVLGAGVGAFVFNNGDDAAVSATLGPAALGPYRFAYDIANAVTYMLTRPVNRLLQPVWARVRADLGNWAYAYHEVLRMLSLVGGILVLGIAVHGPAALGVAYDGRWDFITPTIRAFAVYGLFRVVGASTGSIFVAAERPAVMRRIITGQNIGLLVALPIGLATDDITWVAVAVTVPLVVATLVSLAAACSITTLPRREAVRTIVGGWTIGLAVNLAGVPVRLAVDDEVIGLGLAGAVVAALAGLVVARSGVLRRAEAVSVSASAG